MGCVRSVYYYCISPEPGVCVFFWVGEYVENPEIDTGINQRSGRGDRLTCDDTAPRLYVASPLLYCV